MDAADDCTCRQLHAEVRLQWRTLFVIRPDGLPNHAPNA